MKRLLGIKGIIIFLAAGGLVALALLSAVLRDFNFRPSQPISYSFEQESFSLAPGMLVEIPAWKFLLLGGLLLLIYITLLLLLDPEARKRALLKLFRFLMTLVAIWILLDYAYKRGNLQTLLNLTPVEQSLGSPGITTSSIPEYVPPVVQPWLVYLVSFGIGLLLVLVFWFVYSRRPRPQAAFSLETIAGLARDALDGLQDGHNWDDAILLCYVRMNEVVGAERGITRPADATPAEFALRMERAGLPREAVRTLTRLFESVRYGGKTSSIEERDLAVAALNAILRSCGVNP